MLFSVLEKLVRVLQKHSCQGSRNFTEYNVNIGTPNDPTKILCTKSN
jgi:hypothetical protein